MPGSSGDEWKPLCFSRSPQLRIHPSSTLVLTIKADENVFETLSVSFPTADSSSSNTSVQIQHTERHLHSGLEMLHLLQLSPLETHFYESFPKEQKGPSCLPKLASRVTEAGRFYEIVPMSVSSVPVF